jgi:hypothetical protein
VVYESRGFEQPGKRYCYASRTKKEKEEKNKSKISLRSFNIEVQARLSHLAFVRYQVGFVSWDWLI